MCGKTRGPSTTGGNPEILRLRTSFFDDQSVEMVSFLHRFERNHTSVNATPFALNRCRLQLQ